uniref:Uncharacterized protein n=1 Tax=Anguilla anguilla TaxID=7936 RepID=A0A0E9PUU6_ANGAN
MVPQVTIAIASHKFDTQRIPVIRGTLLLL